MGAIRGIGQFRTHGRALLHFALALAVGGCLIPVPVPGSRVVSSEVGGRVVDGETKQPVSGAEVRVLGPPDARPSTVTDSEGRFHLPAVEHNYLMRVVGVDFEEHIPAVGERSHYVVITHPGYEPLTVDLAERVWQARQAGIEGFSLSELGDLEIVTIQSLTVTQP